MFNVEEARWEHTAYAHAFDREINEVYSTLVLRHWGGELHGFPYTLYGYMMALFARVDLLSAYRKGDGSTNGQMRRMIDFMEEYMSRDREASSVAVHMWQHKLMHTSEPRCLYDECIGKVCRWLLHWADHIPPNRHLTFVETSESRILNLQLLYVLEDLKKGIVKYVADLSTDLVLQDNYKKYRLS